MCVWQEYAVKTVMAFRLFFLFFFFTNEIFLNSTVGAGWGGHSVVLEAPLNVKFWTTALWIYSNVNLNLLSWNIPDKKKKKNY